MAEYIWEDSDDGYVSTRKQELVRCKDCKRHHEHNCEIWDDGVYNPDWFCADGERRKELEKEDYLKQYVPDKRGWVYGAYPKENS